MTHSFPPPRSSDLLPNSHGGSGRRGGPEGYSEIACRRRISKAILCSVNRAMRRHFTPMPFWFRRAAGQSSTRMSLPLEIGRAHVCTPVTNAQHVCRHLLDKKNKKK